MTQVVVALAAVKFAPEPGEHTDTRTLRARLKWLLGRPTTDAGRAWLLRELVRRAYGDPPSTSSEDEVRAGKRDSSSR
jgi:hypothetical protein